MSNGHHIHLSPSSIGELHHLELIDVADLGGSNTCVIMVDSMFDISCMIVSLDSLVGHVQ